MLVARKPEEQGDAEEQGPGLGFQLGSDGEGDWKSWVRWWSGEKWGRWGSGAWWEIWLKVNSGVFKNVGEMTGQTPLFKGMLVARKPEEQGDAEEQGTDDNAAEESDTAVSADDVENQFLPSPTPPTPPPQQPQDIPSTSQAQSPPPQPQSLIPAQPQGGSKSKDYKAEDKGEEAGEGQQDDTDIEDVSNQGRMIDELDRDEGAVLMSAKEEKKAKEVKDITVSAADVVPIVTATPVKVAVPSTRRRRGVVIGDPEEESSAKTPTETKSKDKDKGKGIMVEEPKLMKKKQQVELDEAYARKLHEELNQDIDWEVAIDHVKQKAKENPYVQRYQVIKKRPQTEAQARRNMMMYLKNTLLQGNHLEIMPDEDDDVYTEATPLARKVPIVDYQIIQLNNKPHFKIIRANGTHQLYVSFITLLKNFDREDLESLWSIVKERFSTLKPNNFSNDFLLTTLRAMFGRPDGQDQVWMSQRSVHGQEKVKSWKLLESCRVHIVALITTQLIMLVERRYPLSRFTLDQILNVVRLRVEEQSEMSLELIRFTRQQLQEGQHN
nr:hypothetical protein [Tanacetum cinerariifolium]